VRALCAVSLPEARLTTNSGNDPSSFYVTGGTLPRDAPSYIARTADTDLLESLRAGTYCYVLTSRQMGKSSLMVRAATVLREEGVRCVVLDLTAIGQNLSAEQWYDGLLNLVGRQLDMEQELEAFWLSHPSLGPLQRWMRAIREVVLLPVPSSDNLPRSCVFFIDEIDAVRSLPFSADEFFAGIRECFNRRTEDSLYERITFCLLGVATPADLIRDTRTTPFNIGRRIELHDFTQDEASPLSTGIHKQMAAGDLLLERILFWTHGHPYLTQRLCRAVQEDPSVMMPRDVDRLCEQFFFTVRSQEQDDNLLFVRDRLLRSDVELSGLLLLYGDILRGKNIRDDELDPAVDVLRLSGVVRSEAGRLVVRNRIYARVFAAEWVRRNMPDAELRRHKAAFRRGALRTALASGAVIAAMGALVFRAMRSEGRLRSERDRSSRLVYDVNMNLAQGEWEADRLAHAVEVLEQTAGSPERGFEWYYWFRQCQLDLPDTTEGFDGGFALSRDRHTFLTSLKMEVRDAATLERVATLPVENEAITSLPAIDGSLAADGSRAVTVGNDGKVEVWDRGGRQRIALKKPAGDIAFAVLSGDGSRLATSGGYGVAQLWDANTGRLVMANSVASAALKEALLKKDEEKIDEHNLPAGIGFSPDSRHFAVGDLKGMRICDASSGHTVRTLTMPSALMVVPFFSRDGRLLFTWSLPLFSKVFLDDKDELRGTLRRWEVATGRLLGTDAGFPVPRCFSDDGRFMAAGANGVGDSDTFVTAIYEVLDGGRRLARRWSERGIRSLDFSPDGKHVVSAKTIAKKSSAFDPFPSPHPSNVAVVRDSLTGRVQFRFKGGDNAFDQLAYLAGGQRILASGKDGGLLKVWDGVSREPLTRRIDTLKPWLSGFPSPDLRHLATRLGDSLIDVIVRNMETDEITGRIAGTDPSSDPAFSSNGRWLALRMRDSTVRLLDVNSGQFVGRPVPASKNLYVILPSPDGRHLLVTEAVAHESSGSGGNIFMGGSAGGGTSYTPIGRPTVWSTSTGQRETTLDSTDLVSSAAFTPDSQQVITSGSVDKSTVWSVNSGRRDGILPHGFRPMAVSSDSGRALLRQGEGDIKVWDMLANKEISTLVGKKIDRGARAAFSPDGSRIVTGGTDITVWDSATGRETMRLQAICPTHVAFSSDGRSIRAFGSRDGDKKYWTLQSWQAATDADVAAWYLRRSVLRPARLRDGTP
jgi:WD40 repeat protein